LYTQHNYNLGGKDELKMLKVDENVKHRYIVNSEMIFHRYYFE